MTMPAAAVALLHSNNRGPAAQTRKECELPVPCLIWSMDKWISQISAKNWAFDSPNTVANFGQNWEWGWKWQFRVRCAFEYNEGLCWEFTLKGLFGYSRAG
jgi:hypothetical protein